MSASLSYVEKTKARHEVAEEDTWNTASLFANFAQWESELARWGEPAWKQLEPFKGTLHESAEKLKNFLTIYLEIDRNLSKLFTYAHLKHDEDVAAEEGKRAHARISALVHEFQQQTAWVDPEILRMPDEHVQRLLSSQPLAVYRVFLEKTLRMRPHILTAEKEELVAQAGRALQTAGLAFGAFSNADLKFPDVQDASGKRYELTQGKYLLYLKSADRTLRRAAFTQLHEGFKQFENTLCELIHGEVQGHRFEMKARAYSSCLEAALFPHQIDPKVYLSLIATVRSRLPSLHRYLEVRKKALGLAEMHPYDLYVPLVKEVDFSMDYDAATKAIVASVAPLGKEYQTILEKGLTAGRWVDRYENLYKRSGAYSSGCYDSVPYILMNYHGSLQDVMTLAHEAGHSMHTYLSSAKQPYHYSHYPIFVAEVASTFHEELLFRHLLAHAQSREQRCFLVNQKIDDIRGTLFRQTMFAEFELKLHQLVEQDVPLTPALLKAEYRKLNEEYFGPSVTMVDQTDIEWARIPHFYYNFYVYQYATGISAALALAQDVMGGKGDAKERYLAFLSSGGSQYPIPLLQTAGVDMCSSLPLTKALDRFDALVDELSNLLPGT